MIGSAGQLFATIFGQSFLSAAIRKTVPSLVKTAGTHFKKGLSQVLRHNPRLMDPRGKLSTHAEKRIGRVADQFAGRIHRSISNKIQNNLAKASHAMDNYVLPNSLNKAMGRLMYMGGRNTKFTQQIKEYAKNDIITMPVLYGMYRYDKSKNPELNQTGFGTYYAQTVPFGLGFWATTAASKVFQRSIKRNTIASLKRDPSTLIGTTKAALTAGHYATKTIDSALGFLSTVKRETMQNATISDLVSIKGISNFISRVAGAAETALRQKPKYLSNDVSNLVGKMRGMNESQATSFYRDVEPELTSSTRNGPLGFVNKMLGMSNNPLAKASTISHTTRNIEGINNSYNLQMAMDRGMYNFQGKDYDLKLFNLGKIRDYANEALGSFSINAGPLGRLNPYGIITAHTNPLASSYYKQTKDVFLGGKRKHIENQAISDLFGQVKASHITNDTGNITASSENLVKDFFKKATNRDDAGVEVLIRDLYGSRLGPRKFNEIKSQLESGVMQTGNKQKNFFALNSNKELVMYGEETSSSFGGPVSFEGLGTIGFTTTDSKSVIYGAGKRMRAGNNNIPGMKQLNSRSANLNEIIEARQRAGLDTTDGEIARLNFYISNEIGGGGQETAPGWARGVLEKYKRSDWMPNIFNKQKLIDRNGNIQSGTSTYSNEYRDILEDFDSAMNSSQHKLFDLMTKKGNTWGTLKNSIDIEGYHVTYNENKYGLNSLSLQNVKNKEEALERLEISEKLFNKDSSITNQIGHIRNKIQNSPLQNVDEILMDMESNQRSLGLNYESELFKNFYLNVKELKGIKAKKFLNILTENVEQKHTGLIDLVDIHKKSRHLLNSKMKVSEREDALEELNNRLIDNNEEIQSSIKILHGNNPFESTGSFRNRYATPGQDSLYLVPEKGAFNASFTSNNSGEQVFLKNSVGTFGHILMASLETTNKAMGLLGLGIDNYRSSGEFIHNFTKKRILPIAGGIAGFNALDKLVDNTPMFENTPLQEGLYMLGANAYAGARLGAQGLMDNVGITSSAKYLEELMPGSIDSPLSGFVRGLAPVYVGLKTGMANYGPAGALTGGLVGGGVGMLLGGGILGGFGEWNISENRAELLAKFKGESLEEIRAGRFWELSSGSFWGDKRSFYRPHAYHMLRSDYKSAPNFKTSFFDEIQSYVDPAVYNRRHYHSRPSLVHPGMFSNVPIIGSLIGFDGEYAHTEDYSLGTLTSQQTEERTKYFNSYNDPTNNIASNVSGLGPSSTLSNIGNSVPRTPFSVESKISRFYEEIKDVAGLRGFVTENAQDFLFGTKNLFDGRSELDAPNIGSMSRQFYDLNLGGLLGLNEGIRRILPKKRKDIDYFNPVRNALPEWMPGKDFYINFKHGDPFEKVQEGEARLPGEGYSSIYNVNFDTPGDAEMLGSDPDEAIGYYSGQISHAVPRFKLKDQIEDAKKNMISEIKMAGNLIKEESMVYDGVNNLSAKVDATILNENGETIPVKFMPTYKGKFISGSKESLNAFLVLSNMSKGMLIGIDENGSISETIIESDPEAYTKSVENDLSYREKGFQLFLEQRQKGVPITEGILYSHLDRLRILGDVAYYSKEYKDTLSIVKHQIKSGILDGEAIAEVEGIEERVEKLKEKLIFKEKLFTTGPLLDEIAEQQRQEKLQRYSMPEKMAGSAWEYISYMRNPITSRLVGNRTALQAYEDDVVYGKEFREWSSPIDSYLKPFAHRMAKESDPIQGALSGMTAGYIFGGPAGYALGALAGGVFAGTAGRSIKESGWVPEEIQKYREIMMATDVAERERYNQLYQQTGNMEYKFRMKNTITEAMNQKEILTVERMVRLADKPDKYYMKGILQNMTEENSERIRQVISPQMGALLDRTLTGYDGGLNPQMYTGDYEVPAEVISNYDMPLEDITVKTLESQGLDPHRVGLGWQKTSDRLNYLKEMGMEVDSMKSRSLPQKKTSARINSVQVKRSLQNLLKKFNPTIEVAESDGPFNLILELV